MTASREEARAAVKAAERAFPEWSTTPAAERSRLLERASELLMDRQAAIAALVTEETGGTLGWGMFNVQLATGMLAYYATQTGAGTEEQEISSHIPGKRARAVRQPVGVVVGIAPWNARSSSAYGRWRRHWPTGTRWYSKPPSSARALTGPSSTP